MKLILCADERFGYSFNHRRQTSDREMVRDLKRRLGSEADRIRVNAYTERLLLRNGYFSPEEAARREASPAPAGSAFLKNADDASGWVWTENVDLKGLYHTIDELLLYVWDKRYPADLLFPEQLLAGLRPAETAEFPGYSHDLIRVEHYVLRKQEA